MFANLADQALGHGGAQRGGHKEGLHADVDETGDGAGRVVGVQGGEHHVTGERGVDGDLGGLKVANFTDHHDVRRLAEHGAQGAGEGHADLVANGHLIDAGELIFDGVLDRDELAVGFVDEVQTGIQRGRLAGAGRAGDEKDAVGHADDALHDRLVITEEAELGQAEREAFLVENTHDDGLAVGGRQGGNTQVDLLAGGGDLNAAVLRDAFLGDGDVGHDLQARDHGELQALGRAVHLDQNTVDAVTDAEPFFERLKMDVRRPTGNRLKDDLVNELDDGRVVFIGGLGAVGRGRGGADLAFVHR